MFYDKTILVTGASTGIGREVVHFFASKGASKFILVDRDRAGMETLARETEMREVTLCEVDISKRRDIESVVRPACIEAGRIDILVNNAGVADENEPEDEETWNKVLNVNLYGTYYITIAALPFLPEEGRIINVSSVLGKAGSKRNTAYCTSKHAILGFTKALALDLASRRITVNAVLPGWVDTPMLRQELGRQAALIGSTEEQFVKTARRYANPAACHSVRSCFYDRLSRLERGISDYGAKLHG